jgi:hypothetical protein
MTQTEWFACSEPGAMLGLLYPDPTRPGAPPASERALRLALCACCRRVWGSLGPKGRAAVEAAEAFADGELPAAVLLDAGAAAAAEAGAAAPYTARSRAGWAAAWLAQGRLCHPDQVLRAAATAAAYAVVSYEETLEEMDGAAEGRPQPLSERWNAAHDAERAAQAALLREVFGDPYRRDAFDDTDDDRAAGALTPPLHAWRSWEGGTVPRLAEHVYAERDFSALPVLADALEDAGCTDADLLGHLRGPGPHVRGCWAADLLLSQG